MTLQALEGGLLSPPPSGEPIEVILHESIDAVADTWQRLSANTGASLHHSPDWCSAWSAAHGENILLLEGRLAGRATFLLPLSISRRGGSRVARFIASPFSNINTGLFDPGTALGPDALRAALARSLSGRADLLSLERVPLRWRDQVSPLAWLPFTENINRSFQVPLHASFEETLKQVNAKRRRKKFRLQQRRLEEAGGYEIIEPQTPSEKHALLDEFFRQKAERFRTQGLPDVFQPEPVKRFFHALMDLPGTADTYMLRLHGLRLKGDGAPILAITGTSRKGDHVICQFGSIRDDLLPEASPGEFLFWHVIESACREGAAVFDFGIGDQNYKRSWCTIETIQYDVLLPISPLGQVTAGIHRAMTRVKAGIKSNPRLYAAVQRLRSGKTRASASADRTDGMERDDGQD